MRINKMKPNLWTIGLAATGLISLGAIARAEEKTSPLQTALESTTLSGYVDTSAIWKFGSGNIVPGRSFDGSDKQDGFNLNVVSLSLEKPPGEGDWAAGYRVQLLAGPDANTLGSLSTLASGGPADFAVKNAYVALHLPLVGNGLNFKVGVWDTVVGYEVLEAGNNPNYSRSFGYFIEPIIHTGVLAAYQATDWLSLTAGIADGGAVNTINSRSGVDSVLTYLGSITLTAPESAGFLKGATLTGGVVDGGVGAAKDMLNWYVGGTLPTPLTGLTLGIAYDYRANGLFDRSYENALAGYLLWQATEKLKLAGRVDYATGSVTAFGVNNGGPVQLLGLTGTVDYSLWANAITRLEVRWDRNLKGDGTFGDGSDENAVSLALNVIYNF